MSKKNVVKLLVRLFGDPAHLAKLRKSPAKTLAAAGLTPAERELVLSGNPARLRAYLGAEAERVNIQSKATGAIKEPTKIAKGSPRVAQIKESTKIAKGSPRVAQIKEPTKITKSAPRIAEIKESTKIPPPDDSKK